MSIANKLEKLATDISSAYNIIQNKNGIVPVNKNTENLSTAIDSIPTGGSSVAENDVNFYDYDGTLVDSYTKNQFLALEEMPENPSHSGLTAQGWNWSLSDAKTYVATYGKLDIGQMYITDDGKTRIYIHLEEGRLEPYLGFAVNGSVTVDWGDGNTETVTGTSASTTKYTQHIYNSAGDYVITLENSSIIFLRGNNANGSYILSKNSFNSNESRVYVNAIKKIELGSNISIETYAFGNCYSLASITIPSSVTSIGTYAFTNCCSLASITIPSSVTSIGYATFNNCYSLASIIIPSGVTSIGTYVFGSCYSLASITIPSSVTSIGTYAFTNCCSLASITIPSSVTSIETYAFNNCYSLQSITILSSVTSIGKATFTNCYSLASITIPSSVTSIGNDAFINCYSLASIIIPSGVTSIGTYAFGNCYGISYYDFSNHISVPTLANTNAFQNIQSDCKIIVPDSLYEDWIAATNWSAYADYIYKASEV